MQLTGAFIFTNMLYLEDWILFPGSMWGQTLQDPNFFKPGIIRSVSEFNELEPRLKSGKNRFQFSAGLNLKKLNTILSGTNHI